MTAHYKLLLLPAMWFCHIVDDYYLQGILAKLKQREWWNKNAPDKMYEKDYKTALFAHGFSWAFVMTMPLLLTALWTGNDGLMCMLFWAYPVNMFMHAAVDDAKANDKTINLRTDQRWHFVQVFCTWIVAIFFM